MPTPLPGDTFFDAPGRSAPQELRAQVGAVRSDRSILEVLNGVPVPTFLLNEHRQIVLANQSGHQLVESLGRVAPGDGERLGEALSCLNAGSGPDGCGTGPRCQFCGLGQANRSFTVAAGEYGGEFRLRSVAGGVETAKTFHAHLAPVHLNGGTYRLCSLTDITATKSRDTQEHIFFHDVLNTAQAVQGAAGLLSDDIDLESVEDLARVVRSGSQTLVGEIEAQRDMRQAEGGTLAVDLTPGHVAQIVAEVADLYRHSRFAAGRTVDVVTSPGNDVVPTSRVHLTRSVANLLKNALEASGQGETVRVTVTPAETEVVIAVHNAAVMPEAVQAQVFQRFFSTKARSGRGLGTYSVRLLVTRVLGGTVAFESAPGIGTTFTIRLPRA
jgi:hypothetical protein